MGDIFEYCDAEDITIQKCDTCGEIKRVMETCYDEHMCSDCLSKQTEEHDIIGGMIYFGDEI